jgi:hypothetical protein
MKRLPEKMMMAAIILSCGFVMQTEPTPEQTKPKGIADARPRRMLESSEAPVHPVKPAKTVTKRNDSPPRRIFY